MYLVSIEALEKSLSALVDNIQYHVYSINVLLSFINIISDFALFQLNILKCKPSIVVDDKLVVK